MHERPRGYFVLVYSIELNVPSQQCYVHDCLRVDGNFKWIDKNNQCNFVPFLMITPNLQFWRRLNLYVNLKLACSCSFTKRHHCKHSRQKISIHVWLRHLLSSTHGSKSLPRKRNHKALTLEVYYIHLDFLSVVPFSIRGKW